MGQPSGPEGSRATLLATEIVDRRKVGFRVPLDDWFRTGLRNQAWDILTGPSSFVHNTFE